MWRFLWWYVCGFSLLVLPKLVFIMQIEVSQIKWVIYLRYISVNPRVPECCLLICLGLIVGGIIYSVRDDVSFRLHGVTPYHLIWPQVNRNDPDILDESQWFSLAGRAFIYTSYFLYYYSSANRIRSWLLYAKRNRFCNYFKVFNFITNFRCKPKNARENA